MNEPLFYATLAWADVNGKPVPAVVDIAGPMAPLQTEPIVVVPEEYRDVELLYVDREHGRSATLKGRVLLPAVVRSPDVARGPDGLPLRRPILNHKPPSIQPWEVLSLPRYEIGEGEVRTVWEKTDVALDDFRSAAAATILDLAETRRPRLSNEDVVLMMDDVERRAAFSKRADTWAAIVDAHLSALRKAAEHKDIQAVVDRASAEMVEP